MQKSASSKDGGAANRRGRPRAFDRDRALTAAMHLFWRKGFSATSISDLTAAMEIGSPSLYAAFGSKEALYAEALRCYVRTHEETAWSGFSAASSVRLAVEAFLRDTAGGLVEAGDGCMVMLSAVGTEGHGDLGALVASARSATLVRLKNRIDQAKAVGELDASANTHGLARFVQGVQAGLSILARDGATLEELSAVIDVAMLGWDARVSSKVSER